MPSFDQQILGLLKNPWFALPFLGWSLFWKGFALWRSAGKRQLVWFIILLFINTLGILEILYIFYLNRFDLDKGKFLNFLEKKFGRK